MATFTEREVIEHAFSIYQGSICTDYIREAMQQPTLEKAARYLVIDSAYWDSPDSETRERPVMPTRLLRSDIKRLVWRANGIDRFLRPGQAVCTAFTVPKALEAKIWWLIEKEEVVQCIFDFYQQELFRNAYRSSDRR